MADDWEAAGLPPLTQLDRSDCRSGTHQLYCDSCQVALLGDAALFNSQHDAIMCVTCVTNKWANCTRMVVEDMCVLFRGDTEVLSLQKEGFYLRDMYYDAQEDHDFLCGVCNCRVDVHTSVQLADNSVTAVSLSLPDSLVQRIWEHLECECPCIVLDPLCHASAGS